MKIEITFVTRYWLELTREDVEPLFILGEHHYDSTCRTAVKEGGFIYGWRNIVSSLAPDRTEPPKCDGTWRELDTVLKLCEGAGAAFRSRLLDQEQLDRVNNLCACIVTATCTAANHPTAIERVEVHAPDSAGKQAWATNPGGY